MELLACLDKEYMTTATPRISASQPAATRARLYLEATILVTLMAALYADTLVDMAKDWWNVPAWSQGMLLPPLAAYITWMRRHRTLACVATTDGRGFVLAALASFTFLMGRLASEFFLTRISFVIMLAALGWIFWGIPRLKTLLLPLLLLATMVPLPGVIYNSLAAPLQLFASSVATTLAQAAGVSIYREGNIIDLAGISLGVAEACSGLNSLSAMLVGSLLIGFFSCERTLSRAALLAISVPLAIAINVVRVTATAILADYNREFAMGFYHLFSGWLVFVAGIGLLYGFASLLHRLESSR